MINRIVLIVLLISFTCAEIYAQQQDDRPAPPTRETQIPDERRIERDEPARLPEFELPEYVITGRAVFRLPYVQKPVFTEQSVFVAEVPEVMESEGRDIATTPVDIPTRSFGEFQPVPTLRYGQIRAGYGRFNTPAVSGWVNYRDNPWDLSARMSYLNTEGHNAFAAGYESDGRFNFGYRIPETASAAFSGARPWLTIGFEGLKHRLFDISASTQDPPLTVTISRRFRSTYSEAGFTSGGMAPFDLDFVVGWRGTAVEDGFDDALRTNDDEFYVNLKTLGYLGGIRVISGLKYITNSITYENFELYPGYEALPEADNRFFTGGVTARFPLSEGRFTLELGGNFYSIETTAGGSETMLKPFGEIRLMPFGSLSLYGRFAPEVIHRSVYSLHGFNRYLQFAGVFLPSDEKINVSAGLEYNPVRAMNFHAYGRYTETENYPGIMSVRDYGVMGLTLEGITRIFSLHADVRYQISDRDVITAQSVLRYTKNDLYDTSVTFLAPVEIAAMYTREWPMGLRATGGFEFLSTRRALYDGGSSEDLDMVLNLNLDVLYQFHNIIGVYVKLDNILNMEYSRYYLYPSRPFYIEGGIQISF